VDEKGVAPYLPKIEEALANLSKEDLIKRFVSTEFSRFINYYKNAQDLNAQAGSHRSERGERGERNERSDSNREGGRSSRSDEVFQRLFINIGEMDRVNKGMLVRLICDSSGVSGKEIGRIDIRREFSFVDVKPEVANQVKDSITGLAVDGKDRKIKAELSDAKPREERSGGYNSGPKKEYAKKDYGKKEFGKKDFGKKDFVKKDNIFRKSFNDKSAGGNRKSVFHDEI
jgi:ATP-dependent RNA helicase DeaD